MTKKYIGIFSLIFLWACTTTAASSPRETSPTETRQEKGAGKVFFSTAVGAFWSGFWGGTKYLGKSLYQAHIVLKLIVGGVCLF